MIVKAKGSARLFKSDLLEMGTRTNPIAVLAIYIPLCVFLTWYFIEKIHPTTFLLIGLYFGGLFVWTFFEYILHRYIFHFVNETKWAQRFHYLIHGVHHEYPKDKKRLVMPPMASIIIAIIFFLGFNLILGNNVYMFFSGFITGYMIYDMIHYSLHAFRPTKNFIKFYWEYHNIHHFRHPDKAYGVSSPLWDFVFGTYPPRKG
jgi:sterol desaturase/sphingolipid hydroxylase (fatty acid hydroxylase superfamily)